MKRIISFNPHIVNGIRFFMWWINSWIYNFFAYPDKKNYYLRRWGINFYLTGKICHPLFCMVDSPRTSLFYNASMFRCPHMAIMGLYKPIMVTGGDNVQGGGYLLLGFVLWVVYTIVSTWMV